MNEQAQILVNDILASKADTNKVGICTYVCLWNRHDFMGKKDDPLWDLLICLFYTLDI